MSRVLFVLLPLSCFLLNRLVTSTGAGTRAGSVGLTITAGYLRAIATWTSIPWLLLNSVLLGWTLRTLRSTASKIALTLLCLVLLLGPGLGDPPNFPQAMGALYGLRSAGPPAAEPAPMPTPTSRELLRAFQQLDRPDSAQTLRSIAGLQAGSLGPETAPSDTCVSALANLWSRFRMPETPDQLACMVPIVTISMLLPGSAVGTEQLDCRIHLLAKTGYLLDQDDQICADSSEGTQSAISALCGILKDRYRMKLRHCPAP